LTLRRAYAMGRSLAGRRVWAALIVSDS